MHKFLVIPVLAATLAGCAGTPEQPRELAAVAPYPAAGQGYERHVIWLPAKENEQLYQVELMPGKQLLVDCNRHSLAGELSTHSLQGWGYPYYRLDKLSGPVSTMMACPEQEKTSQFVPVQFGDQLLRYNSKLPLVVYLPAGVELRYRFWNAAGQIQEAQVQ